MDTLRRYHFPRSLHVLGIISAGFIAFVASPWPAASPFLVQGRAAAQSAPLGIHGVQGAAHISLYVGQEVSRVQGVVTAANELGALPGFYLQSAVADADIGTSEGIFVASGVQPYPRLVMC